jgi:hypothetical protein
MDGDRCSRCAAALPVGAPWCTLCFAPVADHREPAGPVRIEPETSARTAPPLTVPSLTVPSLTVATQGGTLRMAGPSSSALVPGSGPEPPSWPCQSCGEAVPLADPRCSACGAAFLAGSAEAPSLTLPGIGNLLARSRGQRLLIGAGISVLLLAVLVAIMWILGSLL